MRPFSFFLNVRRTHRCSNPEIRSVFSGPPRSLLPSTPSKHIPTLLHPHQSRGMSSVEASANPATTNTPAPASDVTVQYVVVRRDLWAEKNWPLGSVIAQACHASTAVLWMSKDDPITASYCAPENIDHMHKVVLEIKDEAELRKLSAKLTESSIEHKLWIEQPEDYATALACKPYLKSVIQPHLKKLKLCKF